MSSFYPHLALVDSLSTPLCSSRPSPSPLARFSGTLASHSSLINQPVLPHPCPLSIQSVLPAPSSPSPSLLSPSLTPMQRETRPFPPRFYAHLAIPSFVFVFACLACFPRCLVLLPGVLVSPPRVLSGSLIFVFCVFALLCISPRVF